MDSLLKKALKKYKTKGLKGVIFGFQGFLKRNKNEIIGKYYTAKIKNTAEEYGDNIKVRYPSNVNENTVLGDNLSFRDIKVRGDGPLEIQNNFVAGPKLLIMTRNHDYEAGEKLPMPSGVYIREPVKIEQNVWTGYNVTILPGVTLGEGCIIQAGSVVVDDIPPLSIAGGHPAKVFAERDEERYNRIKEKNLNSDQN